MIVALITTVLFIVFLTLGLCVVATQTSKRKFKAKIQIASKITIEVESED